MNDIPWVFPRETPNRDDRYMGLAIMHAAFSKDPRTQMGAVIITADNIPRGAGYNGPSRRLNDSEINWSRESGKNDLIAHAEENAIDFSNGPLEGCTIYVTGFPCRSCMELLGRRGIKRIVYLERNYDTGSMQASLDNFKRSMEIASLFKMDVEVYKGDLSWIPNWLEKLKQDNILHI